MDSLTIRNISASPEVLKKRAEAMQLVEETCKSQIQWFETDTVAEYRKRRAQGIGFPKPALYEGARTVVIDAEDGHQIDLRVIQAGSKTLGTLLHFHAGGFVIGSNKSYDNYLLYLSRSLNLSVVSVEYRLAPENPYPAAQEDAVTAAKYALTPEGEASLGGPLKVLAGESAGGYLATWVAMELCRQKVNHQIAALVASYAIYDLNYTPSCRLHLREAVLSSDGMKKFVDTYLRDVPVEKRSNPEISLLYGNLEDLPPALFLCGTEDPLLDDSAFMAARWSLAKNEAQLSLIPGAWHAFTLIPAGEVTDVGLAEIVSYVQQRL